MKMDNIDLNIYIGIDVLLFIFTLCLGMIIFYNLYVLTGLLTTICLLLYIKYSNYGIYRFE